MLLKDLAFVSCDNIGAMSLASIPVFHPGTIQIELEFHFIQDKVLYKLKTFLFGLYSLVIIGHKGLIILTLHFPNILIITFQFLLHSDMLMVRVSSTQSLSGVNKLM
jgi:hypothetical protein